MLPMVDSYPHWVVLCTQIGNVNITPDDAISLAASLLVAADDAGSTDLSAPIRRSKTFYERMVSV